jgi:hypothetical protein
MQHFCGIDSSVRGVTLRSQERRDAGAGSQLVKSRAASAHPREGDRRSRGDFASKWTRRISGAFLLLAWAAGAHAIQLAAQRVDHGCPADGKVLGIVPLGSSIPGASSAHCLVLVPVDDLSDSAIAAKVADLARIPPTAAIALRFTSIPEASRLSYAVKKLSSAAKSVDPATLVGLDLPAGSPAVEEELTPYLDALIGDTPAASGDDFPTRWLFFPRGQPPGGPGSTIASDAIRGLMAPPPPGSVIGLVGILAPAPEGPAEIRPIGDTDWQAVERLAGYLAADVSPDPTRTTAYVSTQNPAAATGWERSPHSLARFFDAKRFTPILLAPSIASPRLEIELGTAYTKASVQNLDSGARRDFDLRGAKVLTLDPSKGALAVVLQPAARAGRETRAAVEVGAARGLTADEIVARERAWDEGQREKTKSFIADMNTSLRFRIAEVNETFDLTILGPFFFRRGEPADWAWHEFYLNGVKWKGKTLPKLPILQPEKVTTLPLDIRLTEDYLYTAHGETTIVGRRAYHILFTPRITAGDRPVYRGSVWIDKETFALLRRDSVQLNLKGETLSNVQTEIYRPVPGRPDVVLPLEIRGEQVFSTAGRTTAIERDVALQNVRINPPDFEERRAAEYASPSQMIRDTETGMRYLVPDPARPSERIVEEKISKKSTFGLLGAFYDNSLDYPIPLLGLQHFNFDLWGKGKQLSVFFGGALLTANYTDPSLAGSRFDLGTDLFAVAFPFGDTSYRAGKEVTDEKVKHLPAFFQTNIGHPFGPYLKGSVSLFAKWDDYQRDKLTGAAFVVPQDTLTEGAEVKLVGNISGFSATLAGSYFTRNHWSFWGIPGTSEYNPRQREYWKYSASIAKDQYFSGFRKLHLSVAYFGGTDLDRFSKYEFGTFSGNPMRGYSSGSVRTEKAWLANVSYGLNIENIIRFEGFYDQALATDRVAGYRNTYFSGGGLLASLNGPWSNSLLRAEIGVPIVSHGVHGFVVNVLVLKLF